MLDELIFFQKKYPFEIKIFGDSKFVIPEYKINLLNKSKKILNSIENTSAIIEIKKVSKKLKKEKKSENKTSYKVKDKIKKVKQKKKKNFLRRKKN